jgi:hypothetical protein
MRFGFPVFFLLLLCSTQHGMAHLFNVYGRQDTIKRYRQVQPLPLTARDSAIYRMVDSMERAEQRERELKFSEAAISGNITLSIFNIDYRRILNYNPYEGIRLGLGLATNQKVASFFSLGGYFSYGFKDKDWKYGSFIQLFPHWYSDTRLTLRYTKDVKETGGYSFFEDHVMGSSEWFRSLLIRQMDLWREKGAEFSFRALHYAKFNFYLTQTHKQVSRYLYQFDNPGYNGPADNFNFTEAGMNIKFGYNEKFIKTPGGQMVSLGTKYPMVWFNLKRGIYLLNGDFSYTKYEIKISENFTVKPMGKSQVTIIAGLADGNIPLTNLYNGHGSYGRFSVAAENSFATMRMDEFFSSEFVSLFFMQNFGKIVRGNSYFAPELCFATNVGYGRMKNPQFHQQFTFNTLEKGYYESGILVINVIKLGITGYGAGVFYRYGSYAYTRIASNFGYKLALNVSL